MKKAQNNTSGAALKTAFPHTIPILTGFLFLGITYGVLMTTSGFPWWLPVVTAVAIFTGSMEFLMVSILLSAFNPLSAFVTALMVGARHIFYGITMLPKYRGMGWKKYYLIYSCCDETFSINYSTELPEGIDRGWFYFWVSFLDQAYWAGGVALGGIFGSFITLDTRGLDFVMTAMFIVIFLQQWEKDRSHIAEYIGIGGSVLCLLFFGPDRFIVPAMLVILLALTVGRRKLEPAYPAASANAQDNGGSAATETASAAGDAQPADADSLPEREPGYTAVAAENTRQSNADSPAELNPGRQEKETNCRKEDEKYE